MHCGAVLTLSTFNPQPHLCRLLEAFKGLTLRLSDTERFSPLPRWLNYPWNPWFSYEEKFLKYLLTPNSVTVPPHPLHTHTHIGWAKWVSAFRLYRDSPNTHHYTVMFCAVFSLCVIVCVCGRMRWCANVARRHQGQSEMKWNEMVVWSQFMHTCTRLPLHHLCEELHSFPIIFHSSVQPNPKPNPDPDLSPTSIHTLPPNVSL